MYRWRVVSPLAESPDRVPGEASRLADAAAAAESFLLAGPDTGDVAVVFRGQQGAVLEWVPRVVGVRCGQSVRWHPWPPDRLSGTELVPVAKAGGDLVPASGQGGIVAGVVGDDLVVVLADPGRPSMVARVAAQNAELFAAEAAGQAIPDAAIDAMPLVGAPAPAAVEAGPES